MTRRAEPCSSHQTSLSLREKKHDEKEDTSSCCVSDFGQAVENGRRGIEPSRRGSDTFRGGSKVLLDTYSGWDGGY